MSKRLFRRRELFSAALLSVGSSGRLLLGADGMLAPAPRIAWRPDSPIGVCIENFWGHRSLVAGQALYLRPAGVSFIRGLFACYTTPSGWAPWQFSSGVRTIQSIEPYAADPTQLEMACDQGTYAVAAGETVVLSAPVVYKLANGSTVALPAQTPLTSRGGTAGTFGTVGGAYQQTGRCTIRVAAGTTLNNGTQTPTAGTMVLHQNFYANGTTLRPEIAAYTAQANAWLAQGFAFDHGGYEYNWGQLINWFGQTAAQAMREQEWAYFAGLGWPPAKVLISDENEMGMDMVYRPRTYLNAWKLRWKSYFQNTLYPRMRSYFPAHTLAFGVNPVCDPNGVPYMDWWPADPNTVLRLHVYVGPDTTGMTGDAIADIQSYFAWLGANIKRLGIPAVHMQEFGLEPALVASTPAATAAIRIANLRRVALQLGWTAAGYSMSARDTGGTPGFFGYQGSDGLWRPEMASGAFGWN